jgi:Domain of Unknown Function (DUF1080)
MIKCVLLLGVLSVGSFLTLAAQKPPGGAADVNAALIPLSESLTAARSAVTSAAFAEPRNEKAIQAAAEGVGAAELALASARARLHGEPRGGAGARFSGTIPHITAAQTDALSHLTNQIMPLTHALRDARAALNTAALAEPADEAVLRAKAAAIQAAELALADAQAEAFAAIQNSSQRLSTEQKSAFLDMGGSFANVAFTQPAPMNFSDHDGYTSLFDGVSLKDWDGNPKFWRVEDGAIIGESTKQNPSGNSYLVYRGMEAKDFTLKFEIKVEGDGGSGFQYRSKTGVPWLANIAENVTANVGPVNLNWMMTGPQADFWPSSRDWTGQFYSENTPMRILAWRGQVVEGAGLSRKQVAGEIGDRKALGGLVKMNDWNQYTVIARGGTLIQILNGQLMAVMVDDDPASSNNQSGLFGIEIEATTRVSVRNVWVKKIN